MAKKKKQTKPKELKPRQYFTFYESFFSSIERMEADEQLPIYKAIAEYALYRKEPNLNGMGAVVWELIKPNLDASWVKFENAKKGGAPKGNSNAKKEQTLPVPAKYSCPLSKRDDDFYNSVMEWSDKYDEPMLQEFYEHWSEETQDKSLMRFELESFWNLEARLNKWYKKELNFGTT